MILLYLPPFWSSFQRRAWDVLGVSVALSEHEVHWRTFLQSLVARGLCGVQRIPTTGLQRVTLQKK